MKKIKDNLIFKIIVCAIVSAIMAFIIVFVYKYYDELAKKGNYHPDNSEEQTVDEIITLNDFNNKKTNITIDNKKYVLDIEYTDAGNLITLNGYAIADFLPSSNIQYMVVRDLVILKVSSDNKDNLYFINKDLKKLKMLTSVSSNNLKYKIGKPIIDTESKDALYAKGNNIYINYVIENLDDISLSDESIVQYTMIINYDLNGTLTDDDNIIDEYTYSDFVKLK